METRILKVPLAGKYDTSFGRWTKTGPDGRPNLDTWEVPSSSSHTNGDDPLEPLREAAHVLRTTATTVAFPTETVYGLGADATRSEAVRAIYTAKGRPSDNPLIVHVSDLAMLRRLLSPAQPTPQDQPNQEQADPIPPIYHPLIARFWPGPLTILLPLPTTNPPPNMSLAPEVSAGQPTFGARMPASALARTLIALTDRPLAAPSANASTRPSPTTAQHVWDDLRGRVALVLDGGACEVGVESTVVDGLCEPPVVLRPGGVGIEEIRGVGGKWAGVGRAYRDRGVGEGEGEGEGDGKGGEGKGKGPRAPGMKYKHYSPRAKVVLYEAVGAVRGGVAEGEVGGLGEGKTVGVIRTGGWGVAGGLRCSGLKQVMDGEGEETEIMVQEGTLLCADGAQSVGRLLDVDLGGDVKGVAHGLFAALRELDRLGADVIFVEGVSDREDIAAAVMNRLRKAATEIRA